MSVCPWCKQNVSQAGDLCPACGKNPTEHPSIAAAGFASFDGFDDMEPPGGGLELHQGASNADAYAPSSMDFASGAFDDDDDESKASLTLEVDSGPQPVASRRPQSLAAQAAAAAAVVSTPPGETTTPSGAPRPALLERPAVQVDVIDVAVLADFGRPPANALLCALYAWRVLRRKRELGRVLPKARAAAAAAEHDRDELLVAIAERARCKIQDDREMAGYLRPLEHIEQVAGEREKTLAARSGDYATAVGTIDARIAAEDGDAAAAQQRLKQARDTFEARSQELARAQAMFKRAEIELRNRQQLARQAAGADARTAPPEHAGPLLQAQQQLELRKREIAAPQVQVDEAQRALREAERAAHEVERRIDTMRSERKRVEQTYSREMGLRSEGLEQAQTERRAALIAISARLIELNSDAVVPADQRAFESARTALSTRHIDLERTIRAIGSADPAAVKKGWIVIGAGALLAVALLVALVFAIGRTV